VLHPHVWHGHSPHQIRSWLADCVRAGLILIPPLEGWRAALIAADIVVGDHGAVTCYAAALDKPVALAAFDEHEVVVGTAVSTMVDLAADSIGTPHCCRNSTERTPTGPASATSSAQGPTKPQACSDPFSTSASDCPNRTL
jgi:hypothetical protein